MSKNLRLSDSEESLLKAKAIELNLQLAQMGLDSIRDTDLCHAILEQTIKNGKITLDKNGEIVVVANKK